MELRITPQQKARLSELRARRSARILERTLTPTEVERLQALKGTGERARRIQRIMREQRENPQFAATREDFMRLIPFDSAASRFERIPSDEISRAKFWDNEIYRVLALDARPELRKILRGMTVLGRSIKPEDTEKLDQLWKKFTKIVREEYKKRTQAERGRTRK